MLKRDRLKALEALLDDRIARRKDAGAQILSATEAIKLAAADLEGLQRQLEGLDVETVVIPGAAVLTFKFEDPPADPIRFEVIGNRLVKQDGILTSHEIPSTVDAIAGLIEGELRRLLKQR